MTPPKIDIIKLNYADLELKYLSKFGCTNHEIINGPRPSKFWVRIWWRIRLEFMMMTHDGRRKLRRHLKTLNFANVYGFGDTEIKLPWWATPRVRTKLRYFDPKSYPDLQV